MNTTFHAFPEKGTKKLVTPESIKTYARCGKKKLSGSSAMKENTDSIR